MFTLGCGDEHRGDVRVFDHFKVVGRIHIGAGGFGQCRGTSRIQIGNGEKTNGRVFGGQARAQRADAAGADDGDAEFLAGFQRDSS